MNEPIVDGGPAFPNADSRDNPNHPGVRDVYASSGMTLRDWFAGQALAGLVQLPICHGGRLTTTETASDAFGYADAMLAARAKGGVA